MTSRPAIHAPSAHVFAVRSRRRDRTRNWAGSVRKVNDLRCPSDIMTMGSGAVQKFVNSECQGVLFAPGVDVILPQTCTR